MDAHGGLLYMVAYNLRKVENRDRYPDPPALWPEFCPVFFPPPASARICVRGAGLNSELVVQRIGAAEARWAHNPEVIRSKRIFATLFFVVRALFFLFFRFFGQKGVAPGRLGVRPPVCDPCCAPGGLGKKEGPAGNRTRI